jgi:hypothetical protein
MGPVNELNKMQLDSQAHRMPQAPLSGPSTIERQGHKVVSETCDGNQHVERTAVARPCRLVSIVVVPSKRVAHGRWTSSELEVKRSSK